MPGWVSPPQSHSRVAIIVFDIWFYFLKREGLYKYQMKNSQRQISCPLEVYVKGIAQAFNWHTYLGGFLHLKPTAECQILTDIWKTNCGEEGMLYKYPWQIPNGKVLAHLVLRSWVFIGAFSDLSVVMGFCTSRPQLCVKYRLWYLKNKNWKGRGSINIPWKIHNGIVLAQLGFRSKVLPRPLTDLIA